MTVTNRMGGLVPPRRPARRALALAAAAGLAALPSPASADQKFQITPLVMEGDMVAGIGLVTSIDAVMINNAGQWLVLCDTNHADTNADQVLLKNGAVFLREGQPLTVPTTGTLGSFDAFTLNNNGDSGWNIFLDDTGGLSTDSGLFVNDALVFQESYVSTSPAFTSPTPYIGFFETKFNDAGQLLVMASVDDPAITSSVDRAVVIMDTTVSPPAETVIAKEGQFLPGLPDPVADFSTGNHEIAMNSAGHILFVSDTTGATSADTALYFWTGALTFPVAAEGASSPVPGRTYANLAGRGLDLNNLGEWIIKASLDSTSPDNEVIIKSGIVVIREGQPVPDAELGPWLMESFGTASGPVDLDDTGRALYFGEWNNPDTTRDTGLFHGTQVLIRETDTVIAGLPVASIASGTRAFALSDNGRFAIAEIDLQGGLNTAVLIELCPADLNQDGLVDFADYLDFLNRFDAGDASVDFNGDGTVDFLDYLEFLNFFDRGC